MAVKKAKKQVELDPATGCNRHTMIYTACLMMVMFLIARMIGIVQVPDLIQTRMAPTGTNLHSEHLAPQYFDHLAADQAGKSPLPSRGNVYQTLSNIRITTPRPSLGSARLTPLKSLPGYSKTDNYIKRDGNCLFRVFGHFKYGDQEEHVRVRKEMVEYIQANPINFQDFVEGDEPEPEIRLENYLAKIRNGAWGDELSIKALSESYGFNIVVLSVSDFSMYAQLHAAHHEDTQDFKGAYLKDEHFELLFQN